jgi:hypothetical protein
LPAPHKNKQTKKTKQTTSKPHPPKTTTTKNNNNNNDKIYFYSAIFSMTMLLATIYMYNGRHEILFSTGIATTYTRTFAWKLL